MQDGARLIEGVSSASGYRSRSDRGKARTGTRAGFAL